MRTNKNTSKIILAAVVALLAMMISYSVFSNMNSQLTEQQKMLAQMQQKKADGYSDSYAYAIATDNLKAGEVVTDADVDFKQFDAKNPAAFENRSDVVNKVLLQDISSGQPFTSAQIAKISNDDVSLKDGYRALTLPADNFQGKSEKMVAGSNVDIYSASGDSSWVMENVKIMSFEGGSTSSSSTAAAPVSMMNASAITFEVSANTISDFISNVSKSKLVLVARSANDKKVYHKKPVSHHSSSYTAGYSGGGSFAPLPNLPKSYPISNIGGESSGLSGLPSPIQPTASQPAVEVIEANVKSKVTFD